ncbi:MAG: hypothetical protein LBH24_03910 [Clostridiales bacterium]|nr:hypothetical protein [Clostridiales bacterium]
MKLWIYTLKDHRVADSALTELDKLDDESFIAALREVCHTFDTATPLVLKNHIKHFEQFNIVRFKPADFVETVKFDVLAVEWMKEEEAGKKKPPRRTTYTDDII